MPNDRIVITKAADIETAFRTIRGTYQDVKPISNAVPHVITGEFSDWAYDLVTSRSPKRERWTPEAFALLNTPGLRSGQKRKMVGRIFDTQKRISSEQVETLSKITGRLGYAGFLFPSKRWTTQRFNDGPSLIERAGFSRQTRDTDIRDPELPKYNPQRDEFGIGFTWSNEDWYIEQRRAYTLISSKAHGQKATLIVRNSSHFYGRDRLDHPVYVSFKHLSDEDLLSLDREIIENPSKFMPWQALLKNTRGRNVEKEVAKIEALLDVMDDVDLKFSQWLKTAKGPAKFRSPHSVLSDIFNTEDGGLSHLREFLTGALVAHIQRQKAGSPLFLASISSGTPPWEPRHVTPITTDLLAALKELEDGVRPQDHDLSVLFNKMPNAQNQLTLVTGQNGDFPVIGMP